MLGVRERVEFIFTRRVFDVTCLFLLAASLALGQQFKTFSGKVVGVIDGDTISVMRDGKAAKVRLHGIDCPESSQAFGQRAKQFASDYCFGKIVRVRSRSTGIDKYGRLLGEVFTSEKLSLNHALVQAGLAWWYRQYAPKDRELEALEKQARAAERGLWSEKEPTAPWDYRHHPGGSQGSAPAVGKASQQQQPQPPERAEATVYVTKSGHKFHRSGCQYLRLSKIAMSRKTALKEGYQPCLVCNP